MKNSFSFKALHNSSELSETGKRGVILAIGFFLGLTLFLTFVIQSMYGALSLETLREFIAGIGWKGVIVYVIFFVVGSFLLISATALSIIAPALFGPWIGFLAILAGNAAAAASLFSLTRWLGDNFGFLKKFQNRLPQNLIRFSHGNGLALIFAARLLMLPASLVSYAAAFLPVSFLGYFVGTILGVLPHCLSTALFIGIIRDAVLAGQWEALVRWEAVLLIFTYAATGLLFYMLKDRIGQGREANSLSG